MSWNFKQGLSGPQSDLAALIESLRELIDTLRALRDDPEYLSLDVPVSALATGRGIDVVTLTAGGRQVDLGSGADTLKLTALVDKVDGGRGLDRLELDGALSGYDIAVEDGTVRVVERLLGSEIEVENVEAFSFGGDEYSLAELEADYGPEALPEISVSDGTQFTTVNNTDPTVSVLWDRVVQQAVIDTETPVGPTIAARAYAMMHTAIYDAWAGFDDVAVRVSFDADGNNAALESAVTASDSAKELAMSQAAHAVLSALFPDLTDTFDAVLEARYGGTPGGDGSPEAALGLDAAADLLALRGDDGANQAGGYADTTGYVPVNSGPDDINDIARWTPENVPIDSPDNATRQQFLTPHWGEVESFALAESADGTETDFSVLQTPGPQPFFVDGLVDPVLDVAAKTITLGQAISIDGVDYAAGAPIPVSKALIGPVIAERFITQAEEVVAYSANLTDEERMSAEFWEDAGGTAFPPATFLSFAQWVSARDGHSIDDDAKLFLAAGNAVMDAGIAAWWEKVETDYARPVRTIRELGELGLIGEEGTDEITGEEGYVIEAFAGFELDADGNPVGRGTQTILAANWDTYQRFPGDASPPFAEYVSGHSTFSAAAAEVLRLFTGSVAFGASVEFAPGSAQFDATVPADTIVFEWDTFKEAADAAGESRLFGGIHYMDGDEFGRELGQAIGEDAYALAEAFIEGTATDADRPFWEADTLLI